MTSYIHDGLTNRIPKQPEDAVTTEEAKRFQEAAWKVHQELNPKAKDKR
jgi:hypothetical protein